MADPTPEKEKKGGWLKAAVLGVLGLSGGAAGTYVTAVVEKIAKPPLPVANFAASTDGLTLTCQNHASGDSGWWDFGDGSPLEPFSPETPSVTHAYTKPGTYSVKLIVRNFTADENQRSVPVEVAEVGKDGPNAPSVSDFTIRSVSPVAVAPATFRVTAEVKNAEHCIWDFGDGRLEVADAGGKIDRLVTFEKSGAFLVQLFVHNGKQAAKQVSTVKVEAPDNGALTAVLTVTDTGTRTERVVRNPSVAITAHSEKGTPEFTRTVMARPGFVIEDAAPAIATVAGIANLAVRVGADGTSATISGQWTNPKPGDAASGSDHIIPLKLTERRVKPMHPIVTMVTGPLPTVTATGKASVAIPLPATPPGIDGFKRTIAVELREMGPNGKSLVVASGTVTGHDPVLMNLSATQSSQAVTTAVWTEDFVTITHEQRSSPTIKLISGP